MYDIFDDIFDDGYGYDNDYGMSDTDVEVELAFEAAMASSTDYDYDYDDATEGFGDVMSKVGNKVADVARNMVRKIGELFRRLRQWLVDKFAPLRAKAMAKDNKTLTQVLKALDGQVDRAAPNRKAEVKQKVARVKRAIMQYIDSTKREVDMANRAISDLVGIAKAYKTIGTSFIEKMNNAVAYGSESENTDDGNDLVEKMNALERRAAPPVKVLEDALSTNADGKDDAIKIINDELPGGLEKMSKILFKVKFEKIDLSKFFEVDAELQIICKQGEEAANRLQLKLGDQYKKWDARTGKNEVANYDKAKDSDRMFDDTSKEHLSALVGNWKKYADTVEKMGKRMGSLANILRALQLGTSAAKQGPSIGVRGERYTPYYNNIEKANTPTELGIDT